jgi:hypothetical protein
MEIPTVMSLSSEAVRRASRGVAAALTLSLLLLSACGSGGDSPKSQEPPPPPPPPVPLTRLSTDTFTNTSSQHATEVEPGGAAFGSTIVTAFQVGRIFGGGGADIGFATSTDSGNSWTNGFLPELTLFSPGTTGIFSAASDAAVAFDAKHNVWMISSLLLGTVNQVAVSRSPDGITWGGPIRVSHTPDADKNWVTCDNSAISPFFGNCYVLWDDPSAQGLVWISTSNDAGMTWAPAVNTGANDSGIGGLPLVQPNGIVIVPMEGMANPPSMLVFQSTNGGTTWSSAIAISSITDHQVAGNLRTEPLPSAAVDAAGNVYVVWQDCRFRTAGASNDLVISTSSDGITWSQPARIPIDPVTSTADHFIPGVGIDPSASGSTAHLGLTYYFYPQANCTVSTCALGVGFISSQDSGATWSAAATLTNSMSLSWLPNTFAGLMVADYISTSYAGGAAHPFFALAQQPGVGFQFAQAIYTTQSGLLAAAVRGLRFSSATEQPVPNAHSDHPPRQFYDLEHRYPVLPKPDTR